MFKFRDVLCDWVHQPVQSLLKFPLRLYWADKKRIPVEGQAYYLIPYADAPQNVIKYYHPISSNKYVEVTSVLNYEKALFLIGSELVVR
jgi:hypothetical protein